MPMADHDWLGGEVERRRERVEPGFQEPERPAEQEETNDRREEDGIAGEVPAHGEKDQGRDDRDVGPSLDLLDRRRCRDRCIRTGRAPIARADVHVSASPRLRYMNFVVDWHQPPLSRPNTTLSKGAGYPYRRSGE